MTKVLIVDDEKYVRLGIKNDTDWSLIDCEVVGEAANGQEGLEKAKELKPDVVISDIKMPKMTGIEMSEILLEKYPDMKVIFLTAYDEFEYARAAIRIGASDYLLKPFEDGSLEGAIQRLLHLHPNSVNSSKAEEQLIPLTSKSDVENKYIKEAIDFIEKNYSDTDFSVIAMAEAIGVSEGHLSRLFKAETGLSINNYLTRLRIRKAMDYLKDIKVKVYEVADKVGYQDIAYFSNTFKKLVGKSPSDYQSNGL
ncbi:two-component system, response regulator YesN [Pseudobutyrivibrio sp. UC1225]|uniref:response regulator transcription factor n=1 Tax=Pseudobutyrivibrio sp. UC1225 TaxID=1798185 RepID=UPI0008F2D71C|nr:response regulator [Pseudobutyrivibrio sp. UC1225]SFO34779.1 two-component system, response regulator YesN [Pseudobutyrivibrio sp. UC1225]